jgi:uncharacterized lipoprotein YddW (UPF0748 family)
MDRRTFLRYLGLGAVGVSTSRPLMARQPLQTENVIRCCKHWTWARFPRESSDTELQAEFTRLREAGIQAVLLGGADERIYAHAKQQGFEVHAWTWILCRGDQKIKDDHPEWYAVSREGKSTLDHPPYVDYYRFLCPSRPAVRTHLAGLVGEIAALDVVDGVHLDYIRYPDVILPRGLWQKYGLIQNEELAPYDFCYCEVCRQTFAAEAGSDPLELADPTQHAGWRQYRYDSVTRVVNHLAQVVHDQGKQITAAVFPTPAIARKLVRQDWPAWNLDAVMPMLYHNFYQQDVTWIQPAVQAGVAALPARRPLYAGLYMPALKEKQTYEQAVTAALAGGAQGVALFGGVRDIPSSTSK